LPSFRHCGELVVVVLLQWTASVLSSSIVATRSWPYKQFFQFLLHIILLIGGVLIPVFSGIWSLSHSTLVLTRFWRQEGDWQVSAPAFYTASDSAGGENSSALFADFI